MDPLARIAFLDIRSYGNWGEGHIGMLNAPGIILTPPDNLKTNYLQPYFEAFPHTQLMIVWGSSLVRVVMLATLMLPLTAFAKRIPAPFIEPVVHEGVRYTVPNDRGTVGYVIAWDVATSKQLWKKTVFRKWICPLFEHDVGKVTEQVLNGAGIRVIGDLQDYRGDLRALVGSFGPKLKQFAFGEDDRPLELGDEVKSISGEETFLRDTDNRPVLRACLRAQAADIAETLKRRRLGAHTVQVKVRYGDFTTLSRQITVEEPLTEARDIYRLGCWLLGREKLVSRPLRLLGLGVSNLHEPTARQLALL